MQTVEVMDEMLGMNHAIWDLRDFCESKKVRRRLEN